MEEGKKRFSFGWKEVDRSMKVFAWTMGSALVVLLLGIVDAVEVPSQYVFVVPIANTVLYSIKEWIADNRLE